MSDAEIQTQAEFLRFTRLQWEKEACVLAAPGEFATITADTIFRLLVRFCDRARETASTAELKFYVSGVRLEPFETLEYLPVIGDRNFTGYHKRISRSFKDYGLVCDGLYSMMTGDFRSTRKSISAFTDKLFKEVGLPNRFAEIGLYVGNYRKTPFGVHVDRCGVLSLPIVGRKTFRIWTPEIVRKNPELQEAFSYDNLKAESHVLTVVPGQMAYWPSADWHIAESDGSFSATWSIGVWVDRSAGATALEVVSPLIQHALERSLKRRARKTALKYSTELPTELENAAAVLSSLSKKEIRAALESWWKAHVKARGFKT